MPLGRLPGIPDPSIVRRATKGPVVVTGPFVSGAGGKDRTYVFLLEGGCSATELRPRA